MWDPYQQAMELVGQGYAVCLVPVLTGCDAPTWSVVYWHSSVGEGVGRVDLAVALINAARITLRRGGVRLAS